MNGDYDRASGYVGKRNEAMELIVEIAMLVAGFMAGHDKSDPGWRLAKQIDDRIADLQQRMREATDGE